MYATRAQMVDLFGEPALALLTDGPFVDGAQAIADGPLDAAMRAAQAEVDGYLASVATLPLARVPDPVRLHACGIAYWYLDVDNPTDGATARYRAAVRYLERVQDGKAGLGLADDGQAVATIGGADVDAPPRVFSDDRMGQFTRGF